MPSERPDPMLVVTAIVVLAIIAWQIIAGVFPGFIPAPIDLL